MRYPTPTTAARKPLMILVALTALALSLLAVHPARSAPPATTCNVEQIFLIEPVKEDFYVIGRDDQLERLQTVYVPHRMQRGRYELELKRKGRNLYEAPEADLLIETRFCNEWTVTEKTAILEVKSSWMRSQGRIIFID